MFLALFPRRWAEHDEVAAKLRPLHLKLRTGSAAKPDACTWHDSGLLGDALRLLSTQLLAVGQTPWNPQRLLILSLHPLPAYPVLLS